MEKGKVQLDIKGQIERITYANEENGYTIAKMKVQGHAGLVTIVGTMYSISAGEVLQVSGTWESHPRYGEQFKVISFQSVLPATIKGIEKYLGSGMIKGIGPVMAKRLVAEFREETLVIIEETIERLQEVPGIGEKRVEMIKTAWDEQKDIRDVMIFLQGQGVSPTYAVKIYKHYGKDAVRAVMENPYRLATDIFGIGFLTADRIAEKLGIEKDSPMRAEAGILHVLHQLADEGNVYYPYGPLVKKCAEILEIEEGKMPAFIGKVASEKKIIIEKAAISADQETSDDESMPVYLVQFHVSETGIATRLKALMEYPKQLRLINLDQAMGWVQKELSIGLSPQQEEAVRTSVNSKVMVVTGGPGTGKTTIINAILKIYQKMGQKTLLAAPTGRAAKRMTEATGQEAKTIHRLLEFSPGAGAFKRNETNPLEADLIIIDETSMVDTVLMYQFLKAVPVKSTLILVGDVDQLPSVGPGNVLKDIIESGRLPTVRLNEIFRQSSRSMIIVNAHRINKGEMPLFTPDENHLHDFHFLTVEKPEEALAKILRLCKEQLPLKYHFDPVKDIQVLTPMHRGSAGVTSLNVELQRELNPEATELIRGGKTMRTGDKVMQIRNNYDKDVYNGDIGSIAGIDTELHEVKVDYDGKITTYEYADLDELVLAYATSVHKSQGSEYPAVIMPVLTQHFMLLQRNLLYTGITRGKKLVILVGTKKALAIAIRNNKPQKRYTRLRERLVGDVGFM
ncbi:MAG TPA: ATP-dependent RecD-like DNA helicase [Syntrophorhabdaceae bacterium]|jgi:exodeoxyribonuclease V alpha subunit